LSAGFDAHKNDPLANINLESKDYYTLTKEIMKIAKQVCDNKIISILEGGYNLSAIQESTKYHVEALLEI
jgi:acetoin utilization deacetylase AcuC-like enzyme